MHIVGGDRKCYGERSEAKFFLGYTQISAYFLFPVLQGGRFLKLLEGGRDILKFDLLKMLM